MSPLSPAACELIDRYPLALLLSTTAPLITTPLPLIRAPHQSDLLVGHFARRNPHLARLQTEARATAIFQGPHAYLSPRILRDRSQAPTWNYAYVQLELEVQLIDTEAAALSALAQLTTHLEAGAPAAWSLDELGARLRLLQPHVVAFEAKIVAWQALDKLGQRERADVFADMLSALDQEGSANASDLAARMRAARARS